MKKYFPGKNMLALASVLLSVLFVAYCQISAYRFNRELKNDFVQKHPENGYAKQEELSKEILLDTLSNSPRNIAGVPPMRTLKLSKTICYYKKPGDWIPSKCYQKGTTIMLQLESYGEPPKYSEIETFGTYSEIYGACFFPSYKRGWRVAIPFLTNTEYNEGIEPEYELFYIRTSDVKKLEHKIVKEGLAQGSGYLLRDKRLYEEGYYLSPDLYQSYFPLPVVLLSAWIVAVGCYFLRKFLKKVKLN